MNRAKLQSGFSLIELLVVMAVILTLLGILFPSLQGVRDQAYKVQCANNMHQLGVALQTYRSDNPSYFPITGDGGCQRRDQWLANGGSPYLDNRSGLMPYIAGREVFKCPLDSDPQPDSTGKYGISYTMSFEWSKDTSSTCGNLQALSGSEVLNGALSNYIILLEPAGVDDMTTRTHIVTVDSDDWSDGGGKYFAARHVGQTAAVLFGDGHVDFVRAARAATTVCSGRAPNQVCTSYPAQPGKGIWCDPAQPAGNNATGVRPCVYAPAGVWLQN